MTIDTIISSLCSKLETAGHSTVKIPIALYLQSTQYESNIICITDADQDFEPSFDTWNKYIVDGNIAIDVSCKSNDNDISLDEAAQMRDDVVDAIRTSAYQIVIKNIRKKHDTTGHVQYSIDAIVQYPIVD